MVHMRAVLGTGERYRERKRANFDGGADRPSTQSRMLDVVALGAGKPFSRSSSLAAVAPGVMGITTVSLYRAVAPNLRHPKQGFLVSA